MVVGTLTTDGAEIHELIATVTIYVDGTETIKALGTKLGTL